MTDKSKSTFLASVLGKGVDTTAVADALAFHIPALLDYLGDSLPPPVRNRCLHAGNPHDAAEYIIACAIPRENSELQRRIGSFIEGKPDILGALSANLPASEPPSRSADDKNSAWGNFSEPAIFHGREKHVAECLGFLLSPKQAQSSYRGAVLTVRGEGGIGKTTVSRAVLAHQNVERAFSHRRSFIACDVFESLDALESALLVTFGLSGAAGLAKAAQPPRAFSATDQHAVRPGLKLIKDLLYKAPALVVLDNFETVWNGSSSQRAIEQYIEELAMACSLIVTIRGAPPPKLECNSLDLCLGPLAAGPAKHTFLDFGGIKDGQKRRSAESEPALDLLLELLDGHALSISLLGRQVGSGYRLSELLVRYRKLKSNMVVLPGGRSRLDSLPVSITVSLDMLAQYNTSGALKLCCFMARLPDGVDSKMIEALLSDKVAVVSLAGVDSGPEVEDDDLMCLAADARSACFKSGLIAEVAEDRWRMLAPILRDIDMKILDFYRDLLSWVKAVPLASGVLKSGSLMSLPHSLRKDLGNVDYTILNALSLPKLPGLLATLESFCNYLFHIYSRAPCISAAENYLLEEAAKPSTKVQDRLAIGDCLESFGQLAIQKGRDGEGRRLQEEAAKIRNNARDQFGEAHRLQSLSDRIDCYRYDEGYLPEEPSIEVRNWLVKANRLQRFGDLAIHKGRYDEGRGLLEEAGNLQEKAQNWWGMANSLRSLGHLAFQEGRGNEGWGLLEEARGLHDEVRKQLDEASRLHGEGFDKYYTFLRDRKPSTADDARRSLESAGHLYDKSHSWWRKAIVLLWLSRLAKEQKRWDEAKLLLEGGC